MSVNLKSLIGKLNDAARGAVESAAGLCLSRTHYEIEIEHYLMKLLDSSDTDAARIFHNYGVNTSRMSGELTRSLDKLKSGNARTPAISPSILKMMTEAWTIGSIDYGANRVRTGHTILALTSNEELARIVNEVSKEFQKIQAADLKAQFPKIIDGSVEDDMAATEAAAAAGQPRRGQPGRKDPNPDPLTLNLTDNAKNSKNTPLLGRDFESAQIIDILPRPRQNT